MLAWRMNYAVTNWRHYYVTRFNVAIVAKPFELVEAFDNYTQLVVVCTWIVLATNA